MSTADAALAALDVGENLRAYDLAVAALAHEPRELRLAHTAVLALARSGALDSAEARYSELGLDVAADDQATDSAMRVDLYALYAQLAKDRAVQAAGDDRRRWARVAADRYEAAIIPADGGYAHGNVAAMALLAGEPERACQSARAALTEARTGADAHTRQAGYWQTATRAEAHVVLGEIDAAAVTLEEADVLAGDDVGARAGTRRRLQLLVDDGAAPAWLLDRLPVPGIVAFSGHRLAPDPEAEAGLRHDIDGVLERRRAGVGYGSLACGADVLWAEALIERGAIVHIVLPFDPDQFIDTSVRPGGEGWVRRHEAIRAAAASVAVATEGPYRGHDELYGLTASLFLGRARMRAEETTATSSLGVVWDGETGTGPAGTGADVARWRRAGGELDVVVPRGTRVRGGGQPPEPPERVVAAALFGELESLRGTTDAVLATTAATIETAADEVAYSSRRGEDFVVVCPAAGAAATLALALQVAVPDVRLTAHAGAMVPWQGSARDLTAHRDGAAVPAAPIEPRTPEGEVYVTEPFAALLALDPAAGIAADYVGHWPTAAHDGELPIYVLRRCTPHPR